MTATFDQVMQHQKALEQTEPQLTIKLKQNIHKIDESKEQSEKFIETFTAKKNELDAAEDKERERVSSLMHKSKSGTSFLRNKGKTAQEKITKIKGLTKRLLTQTYDSCLHHKIYIDSFNNDNCKYFTVQIPKLVEDMESLDKVWSENFAAQLCSFSTSQQSLGNEIVSCAKTYQTDVLKVDVERDALNFQKLRSELYEDSFTPTFVYDLSRTPIELEQLMDSLNTDGSLPKFEDMFRRNKTIMSYFRLFLKSSLCVENLDFYEVVENYMSIEDPLKRKAKANEIHSLYIADEASHMINLPSKIRAEIDESLHHGYVNLYTKAQATISKLMEQDSFPKFLRSNSYAKYEERIAK